MENEAGTRVAWRYTDAARAGEVPFANGLSRAGVYQVHLYCCDSYEVIGATDSIEVTAAATVTLDGVTPNAGEPIKVRFLNGSGNNRDWVGLYRKGSSNRRFLTWQYTVGQTHGALQFDGLSAGDYEARFFFANSYRREARVAFRVTNN